MIAPVEVSQGDSPLILAMPHTGVDVPEDIWSAFNDHGRALVDTDWHIDKVYAGLASTATKVRATFHRYVIDANRDPSGESLYPGQNTTGLCPVIDFYAAPIYHEGSEPTHAEIERRRKMYHAPYHATLSAEIERVRKTHGIAIVYDCHSIRSEVPFLFEGVLPVLNVGTNGGETCAPWIEETVYGAAEGSDFSAVLNGRFRGGWTTRHYGRPDENIHAIQMELAQRTYLETETPPWNYDAVKAEEIRQTLGQILDALTDEARNRQETS